MIDVLILLAAAGFGWLGWHEGLARAPWGYTGLMLGVAAGIVAVPLIFGEVDLSVWVSMGALLVVLALAVAGRSLLLWVESHVRERLSWEPDRRIDGPGGAVFGVVATLGVCWMLGFALAGSALPGVATATNRSVGLRLLNQAPLPFNSFLAERFVKLGDDTRFPRYVDLFTTEHIVDVPAPPKDVVDDPDVVAASRSVWKIFARDNALTSSQGTGFLVGPERLMTAAHVVGKSDSIRVVTESGRLTARVVVCDPEQDIAILDVPGIGGRVLTFADAEQGDPAAVVGFPENGPLRFDPARVRERREWQSSDIYGDGRYAHDAYSVRGRIRSGNSGGPMFDPDGHVLGLVVASSRADRQTGYVLTRTQVTIALALGQELKPGTGNWCD
ncbi:MarP family serine protease [Nocardioides speluncae]|uniref:MarP family serine protease n=1 Tax=Nocardioides speluncae TaxID=2670337 RepID=UPI000D699E71|nr:MarP family serine protease [Nocardioides speluncae]